MAAIGNNSDRISHGKITSIRGSVVDVWFDAGLPPVYTLLHTGINNEVSVEVLAQFADHHVRGIALTPTQGLSRGMAAETKDRPLTVPVGKEIIGRMFDVFDNTIDKLPPLPDMKRRDIHQPPPSLAKQSTKSQIFETGIKAIDVLVPLERGGKAGLFGGAGVGKTVIRACLKQQELNPMTVPEQIVTLLALTGNLFDTIPIEKMQAAQAALLKSSSELPAEIAKRLLSDKELSDGDKGTIMKLATDALAPFQDKPKAETNRK